jgi:hypothetical protein
MHHTLRLSDSWSSSHAFSATFVIFISYTFVSLLITSTINFVVHTHIHTSHSSLPQVFSTSLYRHNHTFHPSLPSQVFSTSWYAFLKDWPHFSSLFFITRIINSFVNHITRHFSHIYPNTASLHISTLSCRKNRVSHYQIEVITYNWLTPLAVWNPIDAGELLNPHHHK